MDVFILATMKSLYLGEFFRIFSQVPDKISIFDRHLLSELENFLLPKFLGLTIFFILFASLFLANVVIVSSEGLFFLFFFINFVDGFVVLIFKQENFLLNP
jgi:hypothetical protein